MVRKLIGISWFEAEDYPRILQIMVDAHIFAPTYELWREKAEGQERRAKQTGLTVVRVIVKPDEFLAWCAAKGMNVDAKARVMYAATFANKRSAN